MYTLANNNITSGLSVVVISICLLTISYLNVGCTNSKNGNKTAIAFYNCENLFDTLHESGKKDEDFTPSGSYHYTQKIYEQKLHNIATVLQNMGSGKNKNMPAIVGLAEIKNERVLAGLVNQPEIARSSYKYIYYKGPDPRGINTALIYRPDIFQVVYAEPIAVNLEEINDSAKTRDILHVCGLLGKDTIHVFVNHWPSRRGDENESAAKRLIAARALKNAIAGLPANVKNNVIIMGDFNDNPTDSSIANVLGTNNKMEIAEGTGLFNPWLEVYRSGRGTECHKGSWNLFDQVFVSRNLTEKGRAALHYDTIEIFNPGFMAYSDHSPRRSFLGTHWSNGYSDHFPVILYLK